MGETILMVVIMEVDEDMITGMGVVSTVFLDILYFYEVFERYPYFYFIVIIIIRPINQ